MADPSYTNNMKNDGHGHFHALVGTLDALSSTGNTRYTISLWADDTLSCNCPGFAIKRPGANTRACKHTKQFRRAQDIRQHPQFLPYGTGSLPARPQQAETPTLSLSKRQQRHISAE